MVLALEVKKKKRVESSKRRSSIQIYWCCSLDSLVEVSEALKPSRAGDIKLIMPRGITQFPFKHFLSLPDTTQFEVGAYS